MDAGGHWTQVTHLEDGIVSAKLGPDAALYLLSRKDAPRGRILRLPLSHLDLADAKVVVPQSSGSGADEAARASIEDFVPAPGHLYVVDVLGGPPACASSTSRATRSPGRICRRSRPSERQCLKGTATFFSRFPPISSPPPGIDLTP